MGAVERDNLISEMKIIIFLAVCLASCLGQRLSPPRNPPTEPAQGQRCAGRNYNGRRCCTPENPCGYGEGDCDGPGDGGANDGHQGCQGDLVCGSNNCKKFGLYYHEKDCCDLPETLLTTTPAPQPLPGVPLEPPAGQRCSEEITTEKDVAPQRTLVMKAKVTVMAPEMAVPMTVMLDARETS